MYRFVKPKNHFVDALLDAVHCVICTKYAILNKAKRSTLDDYDSCTEADAPFVRDGVDYYRIAKKNDHIKLKEGRCRFLEDIFQVTSVVVCICPRRDVLDVCLCRVAL